MAKKAEDGPGEARKPAEPQEPQEPRKPGREVLVLTELEQIKVLADPLRVRILEELGEERTTKQVAERIGEKPTKLYHHVDALEKAGLVERTRTRPNRGTLEKYYVAVAERFEADSRAFSPAEGTGDEERETVRAMISTIFDTSSAELMKLIGSGVDLECVEEEGIVSFVEIRASRKQLFELRDRLRKLIEGLSDLPDTGEDEDEERYRLTVAYFPLRD